MDNRAGPVIQRLRKHLYGSKAILPFYGNYNNTTDIISDILYLVRKADKKEVIYLPFYFEDRRIILSN